MYITELLKQGLHEIFRLRIKLGNTILNEITQVQKDTRGMYSFISRYQP